MILRIGVQFFTSSFLDCLALSLLDLAFPFPLLSPCIVLLTLFPLLGTSMCKPSWDCRPSSCP